MITKAEQELIHRVLDNVDPASECSVGNDEIAQVQAIIERETRLDESTDKRAREFITEMERVLVSGLKLSDADHAHEVFENARALKHLLRELLAAQYYDGYDDARKHARVAITTALEKL